MSATSTADFRRDWIAILPTMQDRRLWTISRNAPQRPLTIPQYKQKRTSQITLQHASNKICVSTSIISIFQHVNIPKENASIYQLCHESSDSICFKFNIIIVGCLLFFDSGSNGRLFALRTLLTLLTLLEMYGTKFIFDGPTDRKKKLLELHINEVNDTGFPNAGFSF